ncbi:MAG: 2-dehydropantoate 2-reductase [Erysipelotrichaceae bacterium]|nr:2-dehydropantoate 2-reductase [Erysipelotrichaceae bacterium]
MERAIQNVCICGRGAVGLTFGELFHQYLGADHFAFIVDEKRKDRYQNEVVKINEQPIEFHYLCPESKEDQKFKADLVIFACKSYSLDQAMQQVKPFLHDHTILMSAINGMASEDRLEKQFPSLRVIHTIAQNMDTRYNPTKQQVQLTTRGELVFGAVDQQRESAANDVEQLFDYCHIPYKHSQQILRDQANKLMFNCGINQVCAAYQITYGIVAQDPKYNQIFRGAMEEARTVLNQKGYGITEEMLNAWADRLATFDPDSMPSMAQDLQFCRPVELDLFAGTIIPWAKQCGVHVPIMEDLKDKIEVHLQSTN